MRGVRLIKLNLTFSLKICGGQATVQIRKLPIVFTVCKSAGIRRNATPTKVVLLVYGACIVCSFIHTSVWFVYAFAVAVRHGSVSAA